MKATNSGRLVGLNTTLHVFKSKERYEKARGKLSRLGTITTVFINNGYGFELRKPRMTL